MATVYGFNASADQDRLAVMNLLLNRGADQQEQYNTLAQYQVNRVSLHPISAVPGMPQRWGLHFDTSLLGMNMPDGRVLRFGPRDNTRSDSSVDLNLNAHQFAQMAEGGLYNDPNQYLKKLNQQFKDTKFYRSTEAKLTRIDIPTDHLTIKAGDFSQPASPMQRYWIGEDLHTKQVWSAPMQEKTNLNQLLADKVTALQKAPITDVYEPEKPLDVATSFERLQNENELVNLNDLIPWATPQVKQARPVQRAEPIAQRSQESGLSFGVQGPTPTTGQSLPDVKPTEVPASHSMDPAIQSWLNQDAPTSASAQPGSTGKVPLASANPAPDRDKVPMASGQSTPDRGKVPMAQPVVSQNILNDGTDQTGVVGHSAQTVSDQSVVVGGTPAEQNRPVTISLDELATSSDTPTSKNLKRSVAQSQTAAVEASSDVNRLETAMSQEPVQSTQDFNNMLNQLAAATHTDLKSGAPKIHQRVYIDDFQKAKQASQQASAKTQQRVASNEASLNKAKVDDGPEL